MHFSPPVAVGILSEQHELKYSIFIEAIHLEDGS